VVEKPLADSIRDSRDIRSRVEDAGGRLWVNLTRRFSPMAPRIHELSDEYNLGQVCALTVTGGARCLATNGIHWLDLACQLFGADPTSVVASIHDDELNPRDESLAFLEGMLSYEFPGRRRFTCTFTNSSAISEQGILLWREASGTLDLAGRLTVHTRTAPEGDSRVTRTTSAEDLLLSEQISLHADGRSGLDELYRLAAQQDAPNAGLRTTEFLIGGLIASRLGERVPIPIQVEPALLDEHWRIS